MIPEEDLLIHEYMEQNKIKIDINKQQRKIEEAQRRKEDKIRIAQAQQQQREMEECSFAPQLVSRKKRGINNSMVMQ